MMTPKARWILRLYSPGFHDKELALANLRHFDSLEPLPDYMVWNERANERPSCMLLVTDCPQCYRALEEYFDDHWCYDKNADAPFKITEEHEYYCDYGTGQGWIVEAKCPECGYEWEFDDGSL